MEIIDNQVKTVSQKGEHIKANIYQAIHKEYNDLFPCKSQVDLLKSVKPLLKDIQKLDEQFEKEIQPQLRAAARGHKDLLKEYDCVKNVVELLQKLCTCHRELSASKATPPNQPTKSAKHLQIAKNVLDSLLNEGCEVKIFKILQNAYVDQQTIVVYYISNIWSSMLVWNTSASASWDSIEGHLKTSLKVETSIKGTDINIPDLIHAMELTHVLNRTLKVFSQKIFTYLIKPIVKFQKLQAVVETRDIKTNILRITKEGGGKLGPQSKAVQHANLFSKIVTVVRFIKSSVFNGLYSEDVSNEGVDPMAIIGSFIWDDLCKMIIADYLALSVPSSNSQMSKYESTLEETIKFENDLVTEGFVVSGTNILSKYVKDINVHFANKVCQDILSEARDIMTTDIHNIVEVDFRTDRAAISLSVEDEKTLSREVKEMLANVHSVADEYLHVEMFAFSACQISEYIQLLLDHVYKKMIEATEAPYVLACQIVYACRDVFELFVNVVPTFHKDNLKLPQMSAVHYNNCMYLAHHCITLGHQFRNSLPGQLNSAATTFVDYVTILRKCGTDCFLEQLRTQQRELLSMFEDCESFRHCKTDDGAEAIKRSFNQMIHHLTRVAKQWDRVLPVNIFKQSVGILLNTVLENILACIFKMEDISAEEAGQLHALLSILVERSPEIIQSCASDIVDDGIMPHVRSWLKFQSCLKLLEASLQEIVSLWNNGEGELASSMNEGEVRILVRALFQNTEKRSQALSKIKHKQEKN